MAQLNEWYTVRFDHAGIVLSVSPPGGSAWQASIPWGRIIRVCFRAGDLFEPDIVYIFTDERPESYAIPTEADGGQSLWLEILRRDLFDAELAIRAAMASNQLFCDPPPGPEGGGDPARLHSPHQLPELKGETLSLTWDQDGADSILLHQGTVIWREKTGWEVYDRFEEIAAILKQKYGRRLVDIEPAPRSLYALYGDSTAAYFHVASVREALRKDQ